MSSELSLSEFRAQFPNHPLSKVYDQNGRDRAVRSKYGSHAIIVDQSRFDSKKESQRYLELRLLQKAGKISNLTLQVEFELIVNEKLICKYIADFCYIENGKLITEDVKSEITRKKRDYRIKYKLMQALHGITILET